ncbi:MAG: phosphomannomutase/phosphoglucomutase [Planctomycetota bacterium]
MSIEKIFKAYDVRATTPEPLNEDAAWRVGHAAAQFLKRSRQTTEAKVGREDTIVVGGDMRPHTPKLKAALIEGIRSVGTHVIDVGMIDTSFIYFAINHLDCVGGIQVTASHNPINYNGFKISGPKAVPIGSASGLDDIKRIAVQTRVGKTGLQGKLEEMDLWAEYRKHVLQFLDLPNPIKIAVDASNGMAGVMVPKVFDDVPNLEITKILFDVTGEFTHEPNPLVEENLKWVQDEVHKGGYALGGCFDGDADRCMFIDENGKTVGCDILTALLAPDFLKDNEGGTIVYDLRSSHIVPDTIKAHGGVPKRDRVGHAFIKKTMKENDGIFAGELSGHFYFKDNFYADSGAIVFAALLSHLSKSGKPLSELVKPLQKYAQSGEINYQVEDKDAKIRELAEAYKKAEIDYLDGITIDNGDWWFNVRKSNTEPLLRLNLEASNATDVEKYVKELQDKHLGKPAEGH